MPRLWSRTIDDHRASVREAVERAAAELVRESGLRAVTMSQVAARAGIGRATLYKYFDGVEEILLAGHERHVAAHLAELADLARRPVDVERRLRAVCEHYARICHHRAAHGDPELSALVHRPDRIDPARRRLAELFTELVAQAQRAGAARTDVPAAELATYLVHALGAAADAPSRAAVHRVARLARDAVRTEA